MQIGRTIKHDGVKLTATVPPHPCDGCWFWRPHNKWSVVCECKRPDNVPSCDGGTIHYTKEID